MSLDNTFETTSASAEQARRIRRLFCAVVMEAIDEAIAADVKHAQFGQMHVGRDKFVEWAQSEDGKYVMMLAGIEHDAVTIGNLIKFVDRGVRTAVALSAISKERGVAA